MAAAILNHVAAAAQGLANRPTTPATGEPQSTSGSSGSTDSTDTSSSSATISANDFLTLLVTEMKNQDPTANTDPNEYINQLVQVNSLEQLIGINQTLTGAFGITTTSTTDGSSQTAGVSPGSEAVTSVGNGATSRNTSTAAHIRGNLSVPATSASAQKVGHALDGKASLRHGSTGISASR